MSAVIYLDYNATTPVDPRVVDKMLPYFTEHYGNPSSQAHMYGWAANAAVEKARMEVAQCLGASRPSEITFTSGATEGINAAIKGVAEVRSRRGNHIVTVQTEHSAVTHACQHLQQQGWHVTYLPVNSDGLLDLDSLEDSLTDETVLVCIMWANNETGVIQPISEIAGLVRGRGIPFMTDATQAVGKLPVSVDDVDILVCSGHKVYGPKGVGAMFVRSRVRCAPLIDGGGQERGKRSGTHNVPGIVGMGEAFRLAKLECEQDAKRLSTLRDKFEQDLIDSGVAVQINGAGADRLPQTSSVSFPDLNLERLLLSIRTLAVGTGSACGSGKSMPSPVLSAMGVGDDAARQTLRVSLGRPTTKQDVFQASELLMKALDGLYNKAA
ncbi:MAG: cysteine desulfurase [Rhodothermaceae bacterium]|nr:cysteine desulfurase family protein [Bacteroidota bacterium]MXX97070.1 cysteine desulfurase [Rhodothermaceae bacterium]MXZ16638.1 cysteine desulfurase [Rhodothermaceae bacterium]MXZ57135.1 cysteine desulfurase [Rhodothermaceae bacterium]MYB90833.1 cysteine desulfurase [Rhodothermaceae bacterium]